MEANGDARVDPGIQESYITETGKKIASHIQKMGVLQEHREKNRIFLC